ncbi:hypothetical protein H0W32_03025 [Patescibacteria group bacterium]|nr:hypothetical protein [Patescibacteria group bacterium]
MTIGVIVGESVGLIVAVGEGDRTNVGEAVAIGVIVTNGVGIVTGQLELFDVFLEAFIRIFQSVDPSGQRAND